MSEEQVYGYKKFQGIISLNFFPLSDFIPLYNGFILIWNYS